MPRAIRKVARCMRGRPLTLCRRSIYALTVVVLLIDQQTMPEGLGSQRLVVVFIIIWVGGVVAVFVPTLKLKDSRDHPEIRESRLTQSSLRPR